MSVTDCLVEIKKGKRYLKQKQTLEYTKKENCLLSVILKNR